MSLAPLHEVLQRQVDDDGAVRVGAATIAAAGLRPVAELDATLQGNLVERAEPRVAFSGSVPAPVGDRLTLNGSATLLGCDDAPVVVTFAQEGADGPVDVTLVLHLPAGWRLGTSFPALAYEPYDGMPVSDGRYAIATAPRRLLRWRGELLETPRGATLAGRIALSGPLAVVADLLSGAAGAVASLTGTVDATVVEDRAAGCPELDLRAELPFAVAVPHFALTLPRLEVVTELDESGLRYPRVRLATTLAVHDRPYADFTAVLPLSGSTTLQLTLGAARAAGVQITPRTIVELVGGTDVLRDVPDELKPLFDAVELRGLFAVVDTRTLHISQIGGSIGAARPWRFGSALEIRDVTLGVTVGEPLDPVERSLLFSLTAEVAFSPAVFDRPMTVAIDADPDSGDLSVNAAYEGTLSFDRVVRGLSDDRLSIPSEWLTLTFRDFGVAFARTGGEQVEYALWGAADAGFPLPFLGVHVDSSFEARVDSADDSYRLRGGFMLADMFFGGGADIVSGEVTLRAEWRALNDRYLDFRDVIAELGFAPPDIPRGLDLGLESAGVSYDVKESVAVFEAHSVNYGDALFVALRSAPEWRYLFGVRVDKRLDLANLPLIDHLLPSGSTLAVDGIQALLYTAIDELAQRAIAEHVEGPFTPDVPLAASAGAQLRLTLDVAGSRLPFALAIGGRGRRAQQAIDGGNAAIGPLAGSEPADGTVWFDVQQTFGPVTFEKVGVRYADSVLWFLMNASVGAAGLTISVFGLGMGSPLDHFDAHFEIRGLGVTFVREPVELSGALVGTLRPLDFAGLLSLRLKELQIGAMGAYTEVDGHPSFFLYAVLNAPLGGPPAFFVTGLAAGFGFNRRLVLPSVDAVDRFPFVEWAVGRGSPPPKNPAEVGRAVSRVVEQLTTGGIVAPSIGDNWIAVGLRFRSFELLDTFALLTIAFGNETEIGLLGLSTVQLPPKPAPAVAKAQLALVATYSTRSGRLAISGQLTSDSYVLSPSARLTGGFAFWTWFSGAHEGDFVVTFGGYSPRYAPQPHYPTVPRLGLDWKVGDKLQITGTLYFALTSSAVMAGGGMSAVWQSGAIRAWFTVQADFLLVFEPFHYYISAGVQLGASVKVDLWFTSFTLSAHLGVGLELWGPPFSGRATVDLSIVSFTISFGANDRDERRTIAWSEFVRRLLPSAPERATVAIEGGAAADPPPPIVQVVVGDGMLRQLSDREGELNWVVDGARLKLLTQSAVPAKRLVFGGRLAATPAGDLAAQLNDDFGVGPTGTDSGAFESVHTVELDGADTAAFAAEPLLRNIPKALWKKREFDRNGVPLGVDPLRDTTIRGVAVGATLTPAGGDPHHSLPIPLRYLDYTTAPEVQPLRWSMPHPPRSNPFRGETVWDTIASARARRNRGLLADAAAAARMAPPPQDQWDVDELTSRATAGLQARPRLALLGESA